MPDTTSVLRHFAPVCMPTNLETHAKDVCITCIKCSLGYIWLDLVSNIVLMLNAFNLVWHDSNMTFQNNGPFIFTVLIYDSTLFFSIGRFIEDLHSSGANILDVSRVDKQGWK